MHKDFQKFKNRKEAGEILAEKLMPYGKEAIILALPRGGVAVGYEVAKKLEAPLDTIVARKIGSPGNPEFGIGAIAPDVLILNEHVIHSMHISKKDVNDTLEKEMKEMERRISLYKSGNIKDIGNKTAILVDDGIATGVTAEAAILSLKKNLKPAKIIVAAPVASRESADRLRELADKVICLYETDNFISVGYWYEEFEQLSDDEVLSYINKSGFTK